MYDIIIIGAGPSGLSAALTAHKNNMNYLLLERGKTANTIHNYPKEKSIVLDYIKKAKPLRGELWFRDTTKEELIEKWNALAKEKNMNINEHEEVVSIRKNKHFVVKTNKDQYESKKVVLAIGMMSNPRKLGIKGEEQNNVLHRLDDPAKYQHKRILVVGGGNSAVEAALSLSEKNKVILSYRKPSFFRLTEINQKNINENKDMEIVFESNLLEINENKAKLEVGGRKKETEVDYVFILVGFNIPRKFLESLDIKMENNKPVLDRNRESSVKGMYLIGDVSGEGSMQIVNAINQGYDLITHIKG
jgi:putative YpdA family bacillithiol system oxidoreductase